MITFVVYENNEIINAIVAENKEDAIDAVGNNIIESIDGKPWIGWTKYEDGSWRPESPYPSWVDWNNDLLEWMPPITKPQVPASWDEENIKWVEVPSPYPSWVIDGNDWVAPTPYPNDGKAYYWDEDLLSWILSEDQ